MAEMVEEFGLLIWLLLNSSSRADEINSSELSKFGAVAVMHATAPVELYSFI